MGDAAIHDRDDPTVYPEEERLGEELLQRWITELLRPLLERYLSGEGGFAPCLIGADQFIYYRQHDATRRFAPDVYVLLGVEPGTRIHSWKTWVDGSAPAFALEIVSTDWQKDYTEIPAVCDEAGVRELIIFDPSFSERPGGEGARFQVHRRQADGRFALVVRTDDDRVSSQVLGGAWFRTAGFGDHTRLRVATGAAGEHIVPTAEESERAEKEAERAEKEAALARIRELEAQMNQDLD